MISAWQWENQTISAACLFFIFIFFSITVCIIWYIAHVCHPASITLCSTRASSNSHAAGWSHPLPVPLYLLLQALPTGYSTLPSFYFFCPLLNNFWAANLQIMAYRMVIDYLYHLLLFNIADLTNLESVHLYWQFVVLCPLSHFSHQKQYIKKVMLFQAYFAWFLH